MNAPPVSRYRWSDNDRHFLKYFLFSRNGKRDAWVWSIVLDSGADEYRGCTLRLRAFGMTLIAFLPPVIKPWRRWKEFTQHSISTNEVVTKGYWDEHPREYGFQLTDGFFTLYLGRQTHDSSTQQSKSWFVPWLNWRHVRFSLYTPAGEHFWTQRDSEHPPRRKRPSGYDMFRAQLAQTEQVPKTTFWFKDYDDEIIKAICHTEEHEWRFGTGWFKWLSLFRRRKIRRSMAIAFSKETGRRKGSWKGGTMGTGIELARPNEPHDEAFARYCLKNEMTYIGPANV